VLAFMHVLENGYVKKQDSMGKPINRNASSSLSSSEGSGGEVEIRDVTVVTSTQEQLEIGAAHGPGCRAFS